ncbi:MAG TPA: hypothetical protein VFM78_01860, partial [Marinobacter sp.]|nr:hypothetical protein [Marinobacter sp.]
MNSSLVFRVTSVLVLALFGLVAALPEYAPIGLALAALVTAVAWWLGREAAGSDDTPAASAARGGDTVLDISQDQPVGSGQAGRIAREHNQLLASMRDALSDLRHHALQVAVQ